MKSKLKVFVGADPEFELTRRGKFEYNPEETLDDNENYSGDSYTAQIGLDGGGEAIEFRPSPGRDEKELVANTHKLFKKFRSEYRYAGLSVAGNVTPLGAHIHIGVAKDGIKCKGYNPGKNCALMFDKVIGEYLMNRSGRARAEYKELSACRTNSHGFEYRTPAAIVFAKPSYVELVVKLIRETFIYYFNNKNKINRMNKSTVIKTAEKLKEKLLKPKDHRVLRDLDKYVPTIRDSVVKYWVNT